MSEDNYNDKRELEVTANNIWKSINILRGVIPVEHSHVYLFLLSGYYDQVFEMTMFDWNNSWHDPIYQAFESEPGYNELLNVYFPIINSIPENKLRELLYQFAMLDLNMSEHSFNQIFEDLLFKLADAQGKYSGEFLLPVEISQFVMGIADIDEDCKIYNPFAGLASFAIYLKNNQSYYGQEISRSTWALGNLRLMRQQSNIDTDYRVEDSIHNWPDSNQFDLVVSNPPFNFKIDKYFADYNWNKTTMNAEQYVLKKGLESIKPNGKVICVISHGTLFRGGADGKFRKNIIEDGSVDTVIALPGGLLKHTGVPVCIMILRKNKVSDGLIKLVDGTSFVIDGRSKNKRLDNEKLLSFIESSNNHDFVREVDIEKIRENDYNLSPQRYFVDDLIGITLKSILKTEKGSLAGKGIFGKLVRTSNLKGNDEMSYTINIHEIMDKEIPSHSRKIDRDCFLVSTKWRSLKPTLFKYAGVPIYIGSDIIALNLYLDNFEVDPHYLISELRSSKVLRQLKLYQNPGAVTSLNTSDFFKIKIERLTLNEQRAKIQGFLELSERFQLLQMERNALVHGHEIESFDEFSSLKHSLGTPRQNILSNAKSLIRFFENNSSDAFKEVTDLYNKRYDTNLVDDLIQIKDDVNHISTILEKGEKGLVLTNFDLKPISIKEIDKALRSTKKDRGNYKPFYNESYSGEISGKAIKGNITLFKILINNILSNADKYAFNSKDSSNQLIIELKATDDILELEIRNNGLPFPNNLGKDKFITKFTTSNVDNGSGLGGYDINRISKYFNNPDWELVLNNDDVFPVIFRFSFPIIPLINE